MQAVLNIGNSFIAGALFQKGAIARKFHLSSLPVDPNMLRKHLQGIEFILIGSDNRPAEKVVLAVLKEMNIAHENVNPDRLSIRLDVDAPHEVGIDRIANTYGALKLCPDSDCLVIDIGTAVTFDVITRERSFIGGAILPGPRISAQALSEWTDKLPLVEIEKPPSPISRNTIGNIQSGIYWGLVGAIERISREMQDERKPMTVIASGGFVSDAAMRKDLADVFHRFEPDLTLLGLYEILKELKI